MKSSFRKCEYCYKLFETEKGLENHQRRTARNNYGCHRLQVLRKRQDAWNEIAERKFHVKNVRIQKHHADVSFDPHPQGSPLEAKEKRCILNLYQSFRDDGKSNKDARIETAKRLKFGEDTVSLVIREKLSTGTVVDNNTPRSTKDAFEKLADEEVDDIQKLVSCWKIPPCF